MTDNFKSEMEAFKSLNGITGATRWRWMEEIQGGEHDGGIKIVIHAGPLPREFILSKEEFKQHFPTTRLYRMT